MKQSTGGMMAVLNQVDEAMFGFALRGNDDVDMSRPDGQKSVGLNFVQHLYRHLNWIKRIVWI